MLTSTFIYQDGYIKRLFAGDCRWLFRSDAMTLLKYDTLLTDAERENLREVIQQYDNDELAASVA